MLDSAGSFLYEIGVDGSLHQFKDYASDGSGSVFALGVLEANYKKGLSIDEGVKLSINAVNAATQRDINSGAGIDVITITNKGARKVLTKEIDNKIVV